jgi:tetratricopeptide (TPR) repeat protein
MRTLLAVFVFLSAPWLSVGAAAQTDLSEAKTQYEEAAYEDALTTLTKASASTPADRVQLEQYRALCLIALGRLPEAERAVSALVEADPTYVPPSSVASPRVLAMVADIRRKELPGVTRRVLDSGRAAYEAKNIPLAQRQFDLLLNLLDDPAMEGRPEREDLRAVAQGFSTLLVAASAAPRPAPPTEPERTAAPSSSPSAPPSSPPPAASPFVPAVVIQETLPIWAPPNPSIARNEYNGAVKVRIGTDGRVKAASIDRPSHPAYDAVLLNTARSWLYKPAMQNGTPIESERVIAVRLRPRTDQGAIR